jgi:methyl-accepting chemotaxis protein
LSEKAEKRSLKNVALTRRFHWAYIGAWLVLNAVLLAGAEGFVLAIINTLPPSTLSFDPVRVSVISFVVALLLVIALAMLGTLWAHRIAGVHIRMEKVLRRAAEGDLNVTLRFRAGDDLEEVEEAFDAMMSTLRGEPALEPVPDSSPGEESQEDRERRSWRSMELTSRYHYKYMAIWIVISIVFLVATYANGLLYLYVLNYSGYDIPLIPITWLFTIVTGALCAFLIWRGFLSSHRLAGVHVKLAQTFQRVAQGEKNVELRFRAQDRLEAVEEAFQALMARRAATSP